MSTRFKIFLFTFSICHLPFYIFSQTYNFRNYSVDDGLPFVEVSTIFQDSKGYLWSGGYGGLSRFDGEHFVNYAPKNGLADHFVNCITESENELWIGTNSGLSIFDGKTFKNYSKKDGLPSNHITALYKMVSGNIIIGTDKGLAEFIRKKIVKINDLTIKAISESNADSLSFSIGSNNGMTIFSGKNQKNYSVHDGLCNNNINAFTIDKQRKLWIATDSGLSCFSNEKFINYHIKDGLPDEKIKALVFDRKGILWIATGKGLCKFDPSAKKIFTYNINNDVSSNAVSSLYIDFEENLWIGTNSGLFKYRGDAFANFSQKDGLTFPFVYQIARGKNNELWISTNGGGIFSYKNNLFKNYSVKDGLPGNIITSCIRDRDSNIWIGSDKGLSEVISSNGKISFKNYSAKDGIISDSVTAILQDKNGIFWLGGHEGITRFDPAKKTFKKIPLGGKTKGFDVWYELQDRKGRIWFGTFGGGLFYWDVDIEGTDPVYFNDLHTEFKSTSALGLAEGNNGDLFFGTLEGVTMWDGKSFNSFTEKDGLSSDLVYSLLIDDNGKTLWVGTNQGLNKIDIDEFKKSGKKIIEPYGKEEGFMGVECNSGAFRDADGTIWFGTVNGLVKYDPKEFIPNTAETKTNITRTNIFYNDTILKSGVELNWFDNNISFDFIGICLTNPAKVRYSYILEGADKNWSPETKNTFARFSNLGPGTYTFKVKSRNNEGRWNETPAFFSFTVLTPWWKTWWFRIFLIMTVVSLIYFVIRFRIRQIQWNENNKVRLANNELKALRAQMNPHFIFNALNSIQHFIMNSDESGASKYLNKFAKLIRSILNNTEKTTVSLKDEVESLRLYIELEMLRFENKFDFEIKVDANTDLDFYEVPTLLIQPYVENAIIHGLVPKKEKGHLAIDIKIENNFILCVITDNGIGRKNSAELKSNSIKKGHKSLGMKITRDRLELLNSVRNSSLSVNITDQYGSGGEAAGTKVEIYIPII